MPTVLLVDGFRFYFYMNEHLPVHVHVAKGGAKAKFILVPEIELIHNDGFKVREVKRIVVILIDHYDHLINKWYETFN
jgi:Domain of unknown function (DUF4160)